ncbi:glycerate kinase [Thalassobacillus cyri]|uniref:Glycerate kinase n=1 Tax=Thalassobacillus cyri TaxID=571932 RepID=A0A1H4E3D5_9BACI|nr:glycerate kinase [Thalassobacillus cyri]SEA79278.1 glycerate kinase [Thalassobacillus cyri]
MKIVIAPDSFKGSLTSQQAAATMQRAIQSASPVFNTVTKPMADGGEGTLDALMAATDGEKKFLNCTGPLGEERTSWYATLKNETAVIEVATIAGLTLVPEEKRNPDLTTSFGIGEAIKDAIDEGFTEILVGLGGSSTNDGGLGMLQALGLKAFDGKGRELPAKGASILKVTELDFSQLDERLKNVEIKVACDVDNPLTGPRGASAVYGPQKGATEQQVEHYDAAMERYGKLTEAEIGKNHMEVGGAGAAGGLGFALLTIGAELVSGAKLIAEAIGLEESLADADLVFTGEGQSDEQTLYGKAPGYVAELARKHGLPIVLVSGSIGGNVEELNRLFAGCFSIITGPMRLEDCITHAEQLLYDATTQIIHLIETTSRLEI